jgi:hypothetical protein
MKQFPFLLDIIPLPFYRHFRHFSRIGETHSPFGLKFKKEYKYVR